jgi:predicted SAM-dependent methyltransferase
MTRLGSTILPPAPVAAAPRLLNLGCGTRFHPSWINVDLQPQHPTIVRHDATAPLPFPNEHFAAVYHSHLLEHLPCDTVPSFLRECSRVLRRGGVLRLALPDLEQIARLYLQALEEAWQGSPAAEARHRWLVMEMLDQATREQPGGAMLASLQAGTAAALAWRRLGADAGNIRAHLERWQAPRRAGWRQRLRGWLLGNWRERLLRGLLGREYALLQLGRFRRGGEIHHWMYDRVALRALLAQAGFIQFACRQANESAIPAWDGYHLDSGPEGAVAKPDSLYVEAHKP